MKYQIHEKINTSATHRQAIIIIATDNKNKHPKNFYLINLSPQQDSSQKLSLVLDLPSS